MRPHADDDLLSTATSYPTSCTNRNLIRATQGSCCVRATSARNGDGDGLARLGLLCFHYLRSRGVGEKKVDFS